MKHQEFDLVPRTKSASRDSGPCEGNMVTYLNVFWAKHEADLKADSSEIQTIVNWLSFSHLEELMFWLGTANFLHK